MSGLPSFLLALLLLAGVLFVTCEIVESSKDAEFASEIHYGYYNQSPDVIYSDRLCTVDGKPERCVDWRKTRLKFEGGVKKE